MIFLFQNYLCICRTKYESRTINLDYVICIITSRWIGKTIKHNFWGCSKSMIFQQMDILKTFLDREEGRERERIDVRVKHWFDASQIIPTGDRALTGNQTSNIWMHRWCTTNWATIARATDGFFLKKWFKHEIFRWLILRKLC